ncbi:hypothetical protein AKJ41_03135 [candidate division MSBL1 archaeon SCGC-AAA259O05]|uniref:Uncharacterized protein n=1 Tax=candidate division MSBL1 archaeon SCGC-AAA259O05 TaxID=1698271 RepID=A0A133V3I4_9EURY|nr:hypothetical protein AKJ41_03135 [candidate division MSBL1 archaeon SCGC-AAA259O05]
MNACLIVTEAVPEEIQGDIGLARSRIAHKGYRRRPLDTALDQLRKHFGLSHLITNILPHFVRLRHLRVFAPSPALL